MTGATADLFDWEPDETYDLVVASLYQMPIDPSRSQPGTARSTTGGGRCSTTSSTAPAAPRAGRDRIPHAGVDHRPGRDRTAPRRVGADRPRRRLSFFPFGPLFERNRAQIERVEELSDAYHLRFADEDVVVAYLLEVTRETAAD